MTDPYEVPCQVLVEMLTDYLEDALSAEDRAKIDAHLGVCPPCVYVLDQFREVISLSGALRDEHVESLDPEVRASLIDAFLSSRGP